VYLPGEKAPGSYAKSKGFAVLGEIKSGEGFWLNSSSGLSAEVVGQPDYGPLSFGHGWNLLGLKSDQSKTATEVAAGQNITSLWAWQGGGWAVFLPGDGDEGKGYAQSKGFSLLSKIAPGEGFWVNRP